MLIHWLSFFKTHCPPSPILHLIIFLCPPAELNVLVFPFQGPLYCPWLSQLFKECWEELMSFLSRISQTRSMFFFYLTILLVLEWNLIFQRSCLLSLIVEMKSERYLFWKRFWKSSFFDKKIQHTSFKIYNPLIVLYFENWNWPVARLKWLFFSWFFVSILNSDFGYIFLMVCGEVTFCGFQETRCSSQNLRLYQERLFLFFSTNFINMHNNQ